MKWNNDDDIEECWEVRKGGEVNGQGEGYQSMDDIP